MNASSFDPYYQWLGIPPAHQPPSHYALLGLSEGEADATMIAAAADQRLAVIEAQRGGPEEHFCNPLGQQLRAARDCLLDPGMKASYDAALEQARIPMAMPIAPPVESELATSAPANPIAPPVAKVKARSNETAEPNSRQTYWRSALVLFSLVAIGVALWLIVTTVISSPSDSEPNVAANGATETPVKQLPSDLSLDKTPSNQPDTPLEPVVVMQEGTGNVVLRPVLATTSGDVELDESGEFDQLSNWGASGIAKWRFRIIKGAVFRVVIQYAAKEAWDGAQFEIALGSQSKTVDVRSSGSADSFHEDEYFLAANKSGEHEFTVRAVGLAGDGLMVLKAIQLEPRTGNLPK